jgi:hypothetical protein
MPKYYADDTLANTSHDDTDECEMGYNSWQKWEGGQLSCKMAYHRDVTVTIGINADAANYAFTQYAG